MEKKTELKRELNLVYLTAIGIGTVVGTGIVKLPGVLAGILGPAQVLAWILTGLLIVMMALNLAELSSRFPEEGGLYIFGKRTLGEFVGFLVGWAYWIGLSIAIGALALATADSILLVLNAEASIELLVFLGILVIVVLLIINILGVKITGITQTILTASKVLVLVALIVFGIFFIRLENITANFAPYGYSGIGIGIMIALWAYLGAEEITPPAEEAKDPEKTIPLAIIVTIATAMIIYVLVSIVSVGVLGYEKLAEYGIRGVEMVARELWGEAGGIAFSIFMIFSFSAVINGVLLANSRILYAFSRDEIIPNKLAEIHPDFSTPWISILIQGVIGILAIIVFQIFTDIILIVDFVMLFPYFMLSLGLLLYRIKNKEENNSTFYIKSPFHYVTTVGTMLFVAYLIVELLIKETMAVVYGTIAIAIGVLIYLPKLQKKH